MENKVDKITLDNLSSVSKNNSSPLVSRDLNLVGHINVSVTAKIGSANITIDKLFSMKSGEVLTLQESLDSPVLLLVDGKTIARGQLVAVGENFGVEINQQS